LPDHGFEHVPLSFVVAVVLFAAFLHALWNSLVRGWPDRFVMLLAVVAIQTTISLAALPFVGPLAPEAWPWLVAAAIPHTIYKIFLAKAYETGELSRVYPVSRGASLLLVAVLGVIVLGEYFTPLGYLGIVTAAAGIYVLSMRDAAGEGLTRRNLLLCMGIAGTVALSTVLDGAGVRLSQNIAAFAAWLLVADGVGFLLYALWRKGGAPFRALPRVGYRGLLAGCAACACYWIAIWALAHAPAALVAALRETSVIFALVLARLQLGESIGPRRWAAGAAVLAGIFCLRFA
jgi:drug/metabolite transporter (DMT)-like permease